MIRILFFYVLLKSAIKLISCFLHDQLNSHVHTSILTNQLRMLRNHYIIICGPAFMYVDITSMISKFKFIATSFRIDWFVYIIYFWRTIHEFSWCDLPAPTCVWGFSRSTDTTRARWWTGGAASWRGAPRRPSAWPSWSTRDNGTRLHQPPLHEQWPSLKW